MQTKAPQSFALGFNELCDELLWTYPDVQSHRLTREGYSPLGAEVFVEQVVVIDPVLASFWFPAPSSREDNMRIQLDLPEGKVAELKALMDETGSESYKDFFNSALTLTKWAIQEVKNGRIIVSLDEGSDKYKELAMPILEAVAPRGKAEAKDLVGVEVGN